MKAVIMAGGLGTRLRPLTCNIPKPMVPVLNRPILEHTIELLKRHKITDIVLLLFYLPDYFKNHFGDGARFGVRISYVVSDQDYGTAGAVKQAADLIEDTCLVVSGDAITDLNLRRFVEFHEQKKALMTIALSRVTNPSPFGIVMTEKSARVVRFLEKPAWGQIFSDTVNMGIYVMEPHALTFVPEDQEFYFARDLFPKLVREDQMVFGFTCDCYWRDIGDLKTYQQVHWDWFEDKIDLRVPGRELAEGIWVGEDCQIDPAARLQPPLVLGQRCVIEQEAGIHHSVVGDGCRIGPGAAVVDSVLWPDVHVDREAELTGDVVASGTHIEAGAYLNENVFVSTNVAIGAHSQINANVKIWPEKQVDPGSVVNSSLVWGDKWQRELFTDSRVTGLANLEITPEFGAKLGAAFGGWLGKGGVVVVSRDATSAARMIDRSIICGLMSAGVYVHDLRVIPIPIVRYILRSGENRGGVHVRRSPFDRKLLDILLYDSSGGDLSPGACKSIERIFLREDFPRVGFDEVGDIDFPVRVQEAYVQDFLKHLDLKAIESGKFRVVIDYSYGAATQVFPTILGSLDCEVISLNAFLNPEKLTRTAKGFSDSLKQLSRIVRSTRSHVGFLIDAGAEKIFCVDEEGTMIDSERLAGLVTALYLDTQRPKKIAAPVRTPQQVFDLAAEGGVEVIQTPDDAGSIMNAAADPEVHYALDTTGGFIFTDFHFAFDGMFALVKILELMARTGQSLGAVNEALPRWHYLVESVPCPWEAKGGVLRRLAEASEGEDRLLIDGVKIRYPEAWVLVIPDRDRPFCHIIAEAKERAQAQKLIREYKARITGWIKG